MPCAMNLRLSVFRKMLKNRCQKGPEKSWFKVKIDYRVLKNWFIVCFGLILDESKKHWFFKIIPRVKKSIKIDPKGRKGTKGESSGGGLRWRTRPRGGGRGREIPPQSRGRRIETRVPLNHLSPEGWWDYSDFRDNRYGGPAGLKMARELFSFFR
jgi:hypothetical protein